MEEDFLIFDLVEGGYSVSAKSGATLEGALVIPETYNGKPVVKIGKQAFVFDSSGLTSVTIPNTVTIIGESAFEGCSGLTSVNIPDAVTTIGESAFAGCSGLTSITIPEAVTTIEKWAFAYCSGLTQIEVSETNTAYCSIDGVLYDKTKNTILCYPQGRQGEFSIPETVTTIGNMAFFCCSGLTSITIPEAVTTIGKWAFVFCSGLTSITIPEAVTTIEKWAFAYCSGLTQIEVSETSTAYCSIDGVLYNKTKNTILCYPPGRQGDFSIPETVTTIGERAFRDCSGLTSIIIPDTVTTIGNKAFADCSGLKSITIPETVTTIEEGAFEDSSELEQITCYATTPPRISYPIFDLLYEDATLYVLEDAVEAYRQHEKWGEFQNIVGIVPAKNVK